MRISGSPAGHVPPGLEQLGARRAEHASASAATPSSSSVHSRPSVTASGIGTADPADVMTRAANTHRASQVVAAQNTTAAVSLTTVPQAALAGLLPMPG